LYDPLFLDLSRRMRSGFFGSAMGGSCAAAVSSSSDFSDVCAFLVLFFGIPTRAEAFADPAARLGRVILLFDGFAFSLDASFVSAAVPQPTGVALTGSIAFDRSLLEFRFGVERLAAYAASENDRHVLAFPEGDGTYYRNLDAADPDGPRVLTAERDAETSEYVAKLLGGRFDSFSGSSS
jgi:hypothetical protein